MYNRIAFRASELTTVPIPSDWGYNSWTDAFFEVMWNGWLSPSTPVLTNMGNDRGHPIACSGTYSGDSIRSWYLARLEIAQLTQRGYGTSTVLDPIRPRGSAISKGGTANGIMQQASGLVADMKEVSQGSSRRGNIGQYLDPLHPDFDELIDQLLADDDTWNIGWNITDEFDKLFTTDPTRADHIWKRMLRLKLIKGKGYFFFIDKANRSAPQMYHDRGFRVRGSNLCSEIQLMSDEDHSFTCVLSSMNVTRFDEWKDTKAVEIATVFLDAVISDMLVKAKQEPGFERIIAFTEKSRAIGLGILGEASYYQQQSWVFGDIQSSIFNKRLVELLDERTLHTSKWLAVELGEPEWLVGYGLRFSHRLSFPPTKSTAEIQGGPSEGCEPVFANVFESDTAGGTVFRINPVLLSLMKERGVYNEETMERIAEDQGSVQAESWLSDHEKNVFKTAFEISQYDILRMTADRQVRMNATGGGQGQSTNLYIPADAKEEYISELHHEAFTNPDIEALYYIRSLNGATKVTISEPTCASCEG
ncbi:MAG: ribonucleoside-diphosphate reductase, partial [Candidatus Thorarchaeota archaeon]